MSAEGPTGDDPRALDREVAWEIFGVDTRPHAVLDGEWMMFDAGNPDDPFAHPLPRYSLSIESAWSVVENALSHNLSFALASGAAGYWHVHFSANRPYVRAVDHRKSPAEAICRAALEALKQWRADR